MGSVIDVPLNATRLVPSFEHEHEQEHEQEQEQEQEQEHEHEHEHENWAESQSYWPLLFHNSQIVKTHV